MYEDLVKRLRKRAVNLKEKFSRNAELLSELMQAANAIEELSKPRWIPVTERLPDKSGNYLTAFEDGTAMAVNEFMHPCDWLTEEGRKAHPNGKWYFGDVTHWQPLPEPPKEET